MLQIGDNAIGLDVNSNHTINVDGGDATMAFDFVVDENGDQVVDSEGRVVIQPKS